MLFCKGVRLGQRRHRIACQWGFFLIQYSSANAYSQQDHTLTYTCRRVNRCSVERRKREVDFELTQNSKRLMLTDGRRH